MSHLKDKDKNIVIRFLQKSRLIITSSHHLKHHSQNHRVSYCVSSGWANVITDRVPWPLLEKLLKKIGVETNFLMNDDFSPQKFHYRNWLSYISAVFGCLVAIGGDRIPLSWVFDDTSIKGCL